MESSFYQIGLILGVASLGGVLALWLRQPPIVSFIVVGVLLGPSAMGWVVPSGEIELFARLGIALLLFVVGLKLDLHIIRSLGLVALATGLGQVLFTSLVGYFIAIALGMEQVAAIYVAVALTFSSTIIIVKLLSDKRELDSLHGRIAVGFLIVQDIVVVLVMIGLTAMGGEGANLWGEALGILAKGVVMLAAVAVLIRWLLPALLPHVARTPELLVLFAIALAVVGAAAGDMLGFSKEVGAFLAGVAIASTPYRELVAARLVSLRDFLLLFFFIELGASLDLGALGALLPEAAVLSLFVLVGNPLIVMVIMGAMGYRKRTGFLAGLTVAQISEFSLILAALGASLGHLDRETVGLITLVGLVTICASTYMILYSHGLYSRLAPLLGVFERRVPTREPPDAPVPAGRVDLLLFGLGRFGTALAAALRARGCRLLAVDFNPEVVRRQAAEGHLARYGDAEDPEFLSSLPLDEVQWVVSTVRDRNVDMALLKGLRERGYAGRVAVANRKHEDHALLEGEGVDLVLVPYVDAAAQAVERLWHADHNETGAGASGGGS